jgi:hypothetical protein
MIPLGLETPLEATLQEAISYLYGVLPKSNASDPDDVTYCHASGSLLRTMIVKARERFQEEKAHTRWEPLTAVRRCTATPHASETLGP